MENEEELKKFIETCVQEELDKRLKDNHWKELVTKREPRKPIEINEELKNTIEAIIEEELAKLLKVHLSEESVTKTKLLE
ncbi:MAG: hypothetical protein ACTSQI_09020 [Candidatus Helarchaeota archaeon]